MEHLRQGTLTLWKTCRSTRQHQSSKSTTISRSYFKTGHPVLLHAFHKARIAHMAVHLAVKYIHTIAGQARTACSMHEGRTDEEASRPREFHRMLKLGSGRIRRQGRKRHRDREQRVDQGNIILAPRR